MKTIYLVLFCFLLGNLSVQAQFIYPFQNTSLSDDERLDNLLSLMTLDEKVSALSTNLGVSRLGIPITSEQK
jgi:beta-glucosidase